MEKHKCKLCSRSFLNGRALGGHMRSHLATLPIPPKTHQLSDRTESASSSSSSEEENREEEEEEEEEEKGLVYGLRENPKKSFKLADPEFSFAVDAGYVVQDRESETESRNPTRRRSKRNRKVGMLDNQMKNLEKKPKLKRPSSADSQAEPEPVSSVSDTSPEEDVAMCLMMLSRDKWIRKEKQNRKQVEEETEKSADASNENLFSCEKYKCETCNKVFPSYQALGGHRASHKKMRNCFQDESESRNAGNVVANKKIHECPFCYRVFGSGQALGGHKRSHLLGSSTIATNCAKFGDSLIDLNLPAPMEDEDISQLEVSAVSDAEFIINPIKI